MATNEFQNRDAADLRAQLVREQATLAKIRFDLADRKLKRTSDLNKTRRTIAKIMTALNTKQT